MTTAAQRARCGTGSSTPHDDPPRRHPVPEPRRVPSTHGPGRGADQKRNSKTNTMKIKVGTEQQYADWKSKNTDPYGARCFSYAEDWANLMEARMEKGEKIAQCAEQTSHEADTDGITGFMYGVAVAVLSNHWQHGEALRLWHNLHTQIGHEGEEANEGTGVLNPALLRIG